MFFMIVAQMRHRHQEVHSQEMYQVGARSIRDRPAQKL